MSNFIELRNMPIVCCDILIYNSGNYLLIRRKQEPCKDQLYFPGGRIKKGESPEEACVRIAKEEVGLDCVVRKFLGVYNTIFSTGPNNIPVHTVNLTYFLHSHSDKVLLDNTSSEYLWVNQSRSPNELDDKLKEFIEQVFLEN